MSPLSPAERAAMAGALTRAADRVAKAAARAQGQHRGKGAEEKSLVWAEVRTYRTVERWLREWAAACRS